MEHGPENHTYPANDCHLFPWIQVRVDILRLYTERIGRTLVIRKNVPILSLIGYPSAGGFISLDGNKIPS